MALLNLSLPIIGISSATEDQKVRDALAAIQTGVNGNLDNSNLSATAAIALGKLGFRIAWGRVNTNGTVNGAGSGGWTAAAGVVGEVTISFSPAMPSIPTVVVSSEVGQPGAAVINGAPTITTAILRHFTSTTGALSAGNVAFVAFAV